MEQLPGYTRDSSELCKSPSLSMIRVATLQTKANTIKSIVFGSLLRVNRPSEIVARHPPLAQARGTATRNHISCNVYEAAVYAKSSCDDATLSVRWLGYKVKVMLMWPRAES
jgi:hypothetical protein